MALPTAPVRAELNPSRARILVHGVPGSGKTTFAAGWYPQTNLIIDVEGGTRWLSGDHYVEHIKTYAEFKKLTIELAAGGHQFTTVTIDTIDALVLKADAEAGKRGGKSSAGLIEYGKGLADRDGSVRDDIGRLLGTDLGLIFLSHSKPDAVDVDGKETVTYVPAVEERLRTFFTGSVDFMWAAKNVPTHKLLTQPDGKHDIKSRVPLPSPLPLDATAAFNALTTAAGKVNA